MRALQHEERSYFLGRLMLLAAILLAAFALSGCAGGRGGSVPYEPANFVAPDVQAEPVASSSQPIGALDTLQINVFQVQSLTGDFRVDQAGQIDYPLIGGVQAQGRTTKELGDMLATRLSEKYLQAPQVTVAIKERAEQNVTVDGNVALPGVFKIKGPTTLMQAIAMAKGTTPDANPSRVIVFRTIRGEQTAGAFDLADIRRAKAEDPVIYGNDIIIVDGSRARSLFRDLMTSFPLLSILRPF
ncbi:MAG TPA: polysaccharide biosynthesis/export family protein [Allosphingosinicella sp.]|jgi:polysaccharide export outer membrane protein